MNIISGLIQELKALPPLPRDVKSRLDKKVALEFNFNSNHIEGNTLTYGETELLFRFDSTSGFHELREYEEMKAHDVAFRMIKSWAADKSFTLNAAGIRQLHEVLLVRPFWKEAITADRQRTRRQIKVGEYKSHPNSVLLQDGSLFNFAAPEETSALMSDLLDWYREKERQQGVSPVELAAQFHYRFVRIHPFDDGNGRMARLLMNYILLKFDLPPVVIKAADKQGYIFALNQADKGRIKPFVRYIEREMEWSLALFIKAASGEDFEEQDDLFKEIRVWANDLRSGKKGVQQRSVAAVKNQYFRYGLQQLFEMFELKIGPFRELFNDDVFSIGTDDYSIHEGDVSEFSHRLRGMAGQVESDAVKSVEADITLKRFISGDLAGVEVRAGLVVLFDKYDYSVRDMHHKKLLTKNYDEPITEIERGDVIRAVVREFFERLKKITLKQKVQAILKESSASRNRPAEESPIT